MNATKTACLVAAFLFAAIVVIVAVAADIEDGPMEASVAPKPDILMEPIPEPEPAPVEPETASVKVEEITETKEETIEEPDPWESIPLSQEVKDHIVSLCDEKSIAPEIVFAMIWRESRYQVEIIGDNGKAFGMMQIHPRWHSERMERLGVTNLLDPIQNATVGIDILDELYRKYGDISYAIVAYNKGHYNGELTQYAKDVLAEADRLSKAGS